MHLSALVGEAPSSSQLRPAYSTTSVAHHSFHRLASSIVLQDTRAYLPLGVAGRPHRDLVHKFPLKERSLEVNVLEGLAIGSFVLVEKTKSWSC